MPRGLLALLVVMLLQSWSAPWLWKLAVAVLAGVAIEATLLIWRRAVEFEALHIQAAHAA